jgi:fused signal recognition particle receptor
VFNWFKKKSDKIEKDEIESKQENALSIDEGLKEENTSSSSSEPSQNKGPETSISFFKRLKNGLAKTRQILTTNIEDLFKGSRPLDDAMLEELEELLITADIGVQTTMEIIQRVSKTASNINNAEDLKGHLRKELLNFLPPAHHEDEISDVKPRVVMVVGINGVGKTTTIGKLAAKEIQKNKKVIIAAADTFRAAATEQLSIWASRAGAEIVRHKDNADPAAVAFDGVAAAVSRNADAVYVDTAGRLHTKIHLMEELKKIKRSISKKVPDAPHEILLVLDATTGQNAISQAKMFKDELGITGLVLTKLDGTAKGGIVISICNTMGVPIKYIGVGESIEDLESFNPVDFVNALL